uniref:Thylakoid lumenal 17.9 kDa protein, chloroplastic n=1 Tax=Aegilops tauschii TaxID=37682 RepID=R7WE74_AEGTA
MASGRLPSWTVEVGPSLHLRGVVVRQRVKLPVRVGVGWWSVWWRAPKCLRKIRTCPSTNPGCVCTNPTVGASSSVASPLIIPESTSADAAAQMLRQAILKTQKNVSFNVDQQTPHGQYIQAEVDGGFGRDVMEFLVKKDAGVVAYRCVATKVTFVYPFTTAIGDSRGQEQRVAAVAQELGWYAPDIRSSVDDVAT